MKKEKLSTREIWAIKKYPNSIEGNTAGTTFMKKEWKYQKIYMAITSLRIKTSRSETVSLILPLRG